MKNKKILWIALIGLDVAITIFMFVVHIIMLAKTVGANGVTQPETTLIGWLQNNLTAYLWIFVIPLFVILAGNIVGLVFYVRKQTKKEEVKVDNLSAEQKEALRQELLKDLMKEESKEEPKEEPQKEE